MKTKKSQQDIIVTVLLVLIAIAAVAVIAYFIINQVRQGTDNAQAKADCLKLDFQITKAVNAAISITVQRNDASSVNITKLSATIGGANWGSTTTIPGALTTTVIQNASSNTNLSTGQTVEVGAILANGATCPSIATTIVTAG